MQKKRNLPKRARYYAGSIDLDLIAAGEDYTKLKKSFVIFICTFDPFQDKQHIYLHAEAFSDPYSFENRCLENLTLTLGDETAKIFLNTRGELEDVDEEMLEFLAYIEDTTDRFAEQAKSPLIRQIHQRVTQIRQSREMEVEYMTLMQRDRENIEQGREEGREEGLKEGRKEGIQMTLDIIRLHLSGKNSREIAYILDLTPSYVDQILQDYESLPG
ncbi:MAG TPA: Rpn family recombination-promoting nuclease/putative transposase [Candidatus Eisenbergiella merdavium]|uniref:Rpn family recombination-promoting nuclease/putative transposase n=1 Tax=Candidatus Eisenbergiella merdavium TaxID=2838551 RepID=A0A9D2SPQ7_9FIRM|nr:Rpn family recombination-promoting nuclease/putative transposase [Candidatus Eisenbergiella merdavium]